MKGFPIRLTLALAMGSASLCPSCLAAQPTPVRTAPLFEAPGPNLPGQVEQPGSDRLNQVNAAGVLHQPGGQRSVAQANGNAESRNDLLPLPPVIAGTTVGQDAEELPPVPYSADPVLWWEPRVAAPLGDPALSLAVDAPTLMALAASHSQRVQVVAQLPWIRIAEVDEAKAAFDPTLFADSRFDDTSDPVGNTLRTGGPPRLIEHDLHVEAGLSQRTLSGGRVKLSQEVGHKNSNSLFFVPNNQGRARMAFGWTQPLLRGRGVQYNTSLIVSTEFETDAAEAEYLTVLQDQLAEVAKAYWGLYLERATLLQRQRHLKRAEYLAEQLEERRNLDALESQIMRVQAAVATRRADLILSEARIKNAETRIRALLNAPGISDQPAVELVPSRSPKLEPLPLVMSDLVAMAVRTRPEIQRVMSEAQVASVQIQVAENELLPTLNFIAETYVAGLDGDSNVGESWRRQFNEGSPSYNVGLECEVPIWNRAANARLRRQQLESQRLQHLLRATLADVQSEVEVAARNVEAAFHTARSRRDSLEATIAELGYVQDRWQRLRGDESLGQLQLDDLLNSQDRLLEEERSLTAAMVGYCVAIIDLQKAVGALALTSDQCAPVPPGLIWLSRQPSDIR